MKKILSVLLLIVISISSSTTTFATSINSHESILKEYQGHYSIENGKIVIDKPISNEKIDIFKANEIESFIADMNILYDYDNIYINHNHKIIFRTITEIENFKSENGKLENSAYNKDNNYTVMSEPGAPSFNLQEKVNANIQYLRNYEQNLTNLMIKYPSAFIIPALQTQVEFADKVAEGHPWDYKREIGWNSYRSCRINGSISILSGEDIGNIHYAYVGRSRSFSTNTLCLAGGVIQVLTSQGAAFQQYSLSSYYDDPTDQAAIRRGANWYDTGVFR